ncbi:hypothetical protein LCGC14_2345710 [marine sediment metagenome]|uniref:Uncharacterized protein n=1 Tax=marine sediment metagenome TaxID=412755 RepID=A0A0F9END4_9ZZZZ
MTMSTPEDIEMDAKYERAEDKKRAWLERFGRESFEAQACEECEGTGRVRFGLLSECPRCLGTGVQP